MFSIRCSSCIKSEEIKKEPPKITWIKSFIVKYKWEGINYPSEKYDWKRHKTNAVTIAVILLMIQKVLYCNKKFPAILRGIMLKHHSNFYCLNCLSFFATENKCKSHKKVCENKDFCNVVMPSKDSKMLEVNQ